MALMNHYLVVGPDRTRFRLPDSEGTPAIAQRLQAPDRKQLIEKIRIIAEDDSTMTLYLNMACAPWWYLESHPAD